MEQISTLDTRRPESRPDIRQYKSLDPGSILLKLYEESRRSKADIARTPERVAEELLHRPDPGPCIELPAPLPSSRLLEEVMEERTSLRFYSEEPVELAQVATILSVASAGDEQDWSQEIAAGVTLHLLVVAWKVRNLVPAVYRYVAGNHMLEYVGPAPNRQTEGADLVLQTEFADAPVIVLITGNLAGACERHGAWGHRQLLLRAGAAGHRLWLSSLGVGLVGTVFAGFLPRAAHRVIGVDGYRNAGLFAYAAGHLRSDYQHLVEKKGGL
ncbi:MAG: nitroreductase family protein [Ktedonobacteraceae bacterium]|nr:nitroreductase family protein [Ktedonobacteraceae bacterium]